MCTRLSARIEYRPQLDSLSLIGSVQCRSLSDACGALYVMTRVGRADPFVCELNLTVNV
jgi:hypothetical protein